jgi:hypothetical protein
LASSRRKNTLYTHQRVWNFFFACTCSFGFSNPTLELLAKKKELKIPKRLLAAATGKSYGEAGVFLATCYVGQKKFPKRFESRRSYGGWL